MQSISHIFYRAKNYLYSGKARSVKAKKNILGSFLIKGTSIVIGLFLVRLNIQYLGQELYGVWTTIFQVIAWFSFFDIGLGHGLRNKLGEALANDDLEKARIYVSSTYAILTVISICILGIFFLIHPFIDWGWVFNIPSKAEEVATVMLIVFSFFCITFVVKLLTAIVLSNQSPALNGLFNLIANFISLLIITILVYTTQGSLVYLSLALSVGPILVFSIATIFLFRGRYKSFAPSVKYIRKEYFRDLMNLGGQFFFIQVTAVIIFSTDNMIITQLYNPGEVAPYAIAFKYFNLITQAFTIITVPFWSAYTEAYAKSDIQWIKNTNKKLVRIWGLMVIGGLFMLLAAQFVYPFFTKGAFDIPFYLSAFMLVFVLVKAWGSIFVMFVNGVGKVRLQMATSLIGGIANIPLSIFFAKNLALGPPGVILASTICLFYGPVIAPLHYKKIMNGTAKGIWNK